MAAPGRPAPGLIERVAELGRLISAAAGPMALHSASVASADPDDSDPGPADRDDAEPVDSQRPALGLVAAPEPGDGIEPQIEPDHAQMWQLVRAAGEGDGEAFGKLYDRYVDSVYRFIFYRVHDRALAEDFTSETFLRALRRISTVDYQGRDIGAWFMTIARNIVFDHVKSARFRLESTTAEIRDSADLEAGPEQAVLRQLGNDRLLAAVHSLAPEQQECIVLRFLDGLSLAETAAAMGKTEGAIKALQHRAVRRLASVLGDELR